MQGLGIPESAVCDTQTRQGIFLQIESFHIFPLIRLSPQGCQVDRASELFEAQLSVLTGKSFSTLVCCGCGHSKLAFGNPYYIRCPVLMVLSVFFCSLPRHAWSTSLSCQIASSSWFGSLDRCRTCRNSKVSSIRQHQVYPASSGHAVFS